MPAKAILKEKKRGPIQMVAGPDVGAQHSGKVAAGIDYMGSPRSKPDSHYLNVTVQGTSKQEVRAFVERTGKGLRIRLKTRKGVFGGRIPQGVVPIMHSWVRESGFEHPLEIRDLQDEGVEMHYSYQ